MINYMVWRWVRWWRVQMKRILWGRHGSVYYLKRFYTQKRPRGSETWWWRLHGRYIGPVSSCSSSRSILPAIGVMHSTRCISSKSTSCTHLFKNHTDYLCPFNTKGPSPASTPHLSPPTRTMKFFPLRTLVATEIGQCNSRLTCTRLIYNKGNKGEKYESIRFSYAVCFIQIRN